MVSPAWIAATTVLLATCVLAQDADGLAHFLQLRSGTKLKGGPEEHVRTMRNEFFSRVRCGAQQNLPSKICQECLSTERILDISIGQNTNLSNETTIQDLSRVSVTILNYMLTFQTSCTVESIRHGYVGSCRLYEQCLSELHGRLSHMRSESSLENLEALEGILREVKAVFEPDPSKQCFSAEMVLNEINTKSKEFDTIPRDIASVVLITGHLLAGECIDVGESVADFLDDIFLHYGDGCERVMSESGFNKLWNDLQMQRKGKHIDHGVQKKECSIRNSDLRLPEKNEKYIPVEVTDEKKDGTETFVTQVAFGVATSPSNNNNTPELPIPTRNKSGAFIWTPIFLPSSGSTSDSETANSTNLTGSLENKTANLNLFLNPNLYLVHEDRVDRKVEEKADDVPTNVPSSYRRVRHTIYPEDHEHKNLANECLPTDDLLQRFLTPGDKVITSSAFLQLCPALVQQAVSGVCSSRLKTDYLNVPRTNYTDDVPQQMVSNRANPWFAALAVTIITAASLLGLFLLPVLKKSFFSHINAFFTGLAFGTMSGDVVLHIMPQYLGLHKHDENGHEHDNESMMDRLFPSHLQRQLAFLMTMYVLFLVECFFSAFMGEENVHHGHSHGPIDVPMRDLTVVSDVADTEIKPKPSRCTRIADFLKPSNLFTGISSKAVVIVLADTVHNFADGMAIAVGFSMSYKDGISTSVAVLFHELPHEIGDFAVLMNSGMGYWKAFVFNILSGLSAFLGLGVGVFTASVFREWLLCITAGLFFFVVMVELLPDMRLESKAKWKVFLVKIFGTLIGIGTMICIAMYELYAS